MQHYYTTQAQTIADNLDKILTLIRATATIPTTALNQIQQLIEHTREETNTLDDLHNDLQNDLDQEKEDHENTQNKLDDLRVSTPLLAHILDTYPHLTEDLHTLTEHLRHTNAPATHTTTIEHTLHLLRLITDLL